MRRLFRFLHGYEKHLILGPLFKLVEAVFELLVPLVVADMIDRGVRGGAGTGYLLRQGGLLAALAACGLAFALIAQYFAAQAQQGVGTALRRALFAHIGTLSHRELDAIGTPSLVTRMTQDINALQNAVAMFIRLVVRAPFLVIGAVVMSFIIDPKSALILVCIAPVIALVIYLIMSRSVPYYKRMQSATDRVSAKAREGLSGARVMRAFAREEDARAGFREASGEVADIAVRVGRLSALLNPLCSALMNAGIFFVILLASYRVDRGDLLQGEVIALVNYMTQVMLALVVVSNLVVIFTRAFASAKRVNEVFEMTSSVPDEGTLDATAAQGDAALSFCDVSFSYTNGGEDELSHIDLTIPAGQTVAFIGGTGSGKSTLMSLIPRFYPIERGELRFFGRPIREYTLESLRRSIGFVFQDCSLLSGTIASNMRMSAPDATDEEIEEALRLAQAWSFVSALPAGIESRVERGGKNFSGGQKQRLTIARALVRHPRILILDDSTSALDAETDYALRMGLRGLRDTTVLLVSQRAAAVKNADRIVVMDNGRIIGQGSHEALLRDCPVYAEICRSQNLGEEGSIGA